MTEEEHIQFDEITLKRLQFVKWLELYGGRPDKHGVQTRIPAFEKEQGGQPEPARRSSSFIPDNTTGV